MRVLFLLPAIFVACASQPPSQRPRTRQEPASNPALRDERPALAETPTDAQAPSKMARAALLPTLDSSPGYFLQNVQTEPRLVGGRFTGWRLVSFYPGDPRFAGVDLQAGDVVTQVNGRPLEKPDQLMELWTDLRSAHELVVELERRGRRHTLRWIITDK